MLLFFVFLWQNIPIFSFFPQDHLDVSDSFQNGTHQRVKDGVVVFDASLAVVEDDVEKGVVHSPTNPVQNEQNVAGRNLILLTPSILTFPWQPRVGAYQYTIKATGGSGKYKWTSSNTHVATVTVKGVLITASDIGVSKIYAYDKRNPLNVGEMKVYVLEPVKMVFAPCPVEARVGTTLEIPLRMFGQLEEKMQRVMFIDCSHFDLQIDEELKDRLAPGQGYCSGVRAKALAPGHATLSVSYKQGNFHLTANTTIAAYPPLIAIDPVSVAVVTLGSSKNMLFGGGPQPWVRDPSKFFCDLKAENEKNMSFTRTSPLSQNYNQHFVRATCRELGEQMLELIVSNKDCVTNPYPAVERVSVKFVCTPPSRLKLVPLNTIPELEKPCPLMQPNKTVVPVSNYRNSILDLEAFDQQGRRFDNFSSLNIVWLSSKVELASFDPILPMTLQLFEDENKQMKLHGWQTVVVHRQSGIALVTATVQNYHLPHMKAASIYAGNEVFAPVSARLELIIIEEVTVFPDTLTLFNHPDVRVNLTLREGSGHFFLNTSIKDIADVVLEDTQRAAQITPIQAGVVQVMVNDLCLALPSTAKATVHVSDILAVNLSMAEKVEMGNSIKFYVSVLDDNNKPFPASYFQFMKLKVTATSSIVYIIALANSTENGSAVYLLKGVSNGQTTLSASVVDRNEKIILSAPHPIEVFQLFKLIPRKITLLVGAMMQITFDGEPQPQSNIIFSVSNEAIASINGLGHIKGVAIGNVTVTGLIQSVDVENGQTVNVWKDQIEVEVVCLTALQIKAPITCIKKGAQANVELKSEHNFGMSVTGRTRGLTRLKVVIKVVNPNRGQFAGNLLELKDEIQIEVYDNQYMINPNVESGEILMAPNSVLKLQTSRDGVGVFSYQILNGTNQTSVAQVNDKGHLFSGPLPGISSLLVTSKESFGVNQTLIIAVKVVPVCYVRFSASPVLHTFSMESLKAFPLGLVLTLTVHFHTMTGEALHSTNNRLTVSTNRQDLVQVSSGPDHHTWTVKTVNIGLTLLSVHDNENTVVADYIPLPVEYAIQPEEIQTLVVGFVICFTTQLATQQGDHGTWSSSANATLQVDAKTGAAVARDYGTATVYYEIPGVVKSYREVKVESSTKTAAIAEALPVRIGKQTRVLLITKGEGTNLIGMCTSTQKEAIEQLQPETSVICQLSFTSHAVNFPARSIFKTHTSFDPNIGFYTCSMTLQPMADQLTRFMSMPMPNLVVKAGLKDGSFSGEQISIRLPIELGLYCDLPELILSTLQPSAELTVFGPAAALAGMEVVSSSPDIGIQTIETNSSPAPHSKLSIQALHLRATGSASVTINSTFLGQSLMIPITLIHVAQLRAYTQATAAPLVNKNREIPLDDSYHLMLITLFTTVACASIIYIVLHSLFLRTQQTYPLTFVLRTPLPVADSSVIPDRSHRVRLWSVNY
ncbi:nuclear pore membrane glycoprotein 210-like isoform X2 [Stigmatopora nigra]